MRTGAMVWMLCAAMLCVTGCSSPEEIRITEYRGVPDEEETSAQAQADALIQAGAAAQTGIQASSGTSEQSGISVLPGTSEQSGSSVQPGTSAQTGIQAQDEAEVVVYVCGAVLHPDVYRLPEGARVNDALQAAGGFAPGADTEWINLAKPLEDGEMLVFYTTEETSVMEKDSAAAGTASGIVSGTVSGEGSSLADNGLVNLNSATREMLMTLPGIGGSRADAIIRYREEKGPFLSAEDIMNISGIKDSIYTKIKDRITV